jgi:hypothetical protein
MKNAFFHFYILKGETIWRFGNLYETFQATTAVVKEES